MRWRDGEDLRREPLEARKATLASLLRRGASDRYSHTPETWGLEGIAPNGPTNHADECLMLGADRTTFARSELYRF